MAGLTKVLLIAEDFPQLNIAPDSNILRDSRKMNIIHQASHVYVFEDINDVTSEKNGTLKLILQLKEHMPSDNASMHAIRKEFLKKVFAGYIRQIPITTDLESEPKE